MASVSIESRTIDGFEVYNVGKSQLWEWAHWAAAGAGNAQACHGVPQTVEVMAESLAKGSYVVMELQYCSPVADDSEKPCILDAKVVLKPGAMVTTCSLREAIEYADVYKIDAAPCGDGDSVAALVEVWHVVDDAELWQEWEYGVVQSHIAQGWDTDYHLLENCRCVLDCAHELPKVVFCIKTMLADGETVFSVNYYADGESADGALDLDCGLYGCELEDIQAYYATELGITVVNDDDLDEGRADALPVVVFYLRLPDDEQLPSITK